MMPSTVEYEAEVIPGIEAIAMNELRTVCASQISAIRQTRAGFLRFRFSGSPGMLSALRSLVAVYQIHCFAVPRPKALLGHEHFTRMTQILRAAKGRFCTAPETMGIAAAGSQTTVMRRLRQELSHALGLRPANDGKGELFLRLLRQDVGSGWELLVRTTASPLSKRAYRVEDVPGALNATVAFAMTRLQQLSGPTTVVNLCSGSSTILIEHALTQDAGRLIAIDSSRRMIEHGRRNAQAAQQEHRIFHLRADAGQVPLPAHTVDLLYADLPFGHHSGTHADNVMLYPALLQEASRLADRNATFVLLTHELKFIQSCLRESSWRVVREMTINLSGLHPRLFVLEKNSDRI